MNNNRIENLNRKWANDALKRAERWESLAKKNKASGNLDLAIVAARQARANRRDVRGYNK